MAKSTDRFVHLLIVVGIILAFRAEAVPDFTVQPAKYFKPTISIQSQFEFVGDTVTIPIDLEMPSASISGFQFKINTMPQILDFIQIEAGNGIADDTTWQVLGNVQVDGSVQILGFNMACDCLDSGNHEVVNVKAVISSSAEIGRHFVSISDCIISDSVGNSIESVTTDGELFVTKSGVLFTAYDNSLWAGSTGSAVDIILRNKKPIAGFQLDVADSGNYFSVKSISVDLPTGWTAQFNEIDSTTTRIICAGFGQSIALNSETRISLNVDVGPLLKAGNYPFKIGNVVVSDLSGQPLFAECVAESICVINDAPLAFDLIEPLSGTQWTIPSWDFDTATVQFKWNSSVDPERQPLNYRVVWYVSGTPEVSDTIPADNMGNDTTLIVDRVCLLRRLLTTGSKSSVYHFYWFVEASDGINRTKSSRENLLNVEVPSGIESPDGKLPKRFALMQNYPNPFNLVTTIGFAVPNESNIRIEIYDILGRQVVSLADGATSAGFHRIFWNSADASGTQMNSGIYFVQMTAGQFTARRKIVLLK
ncbi:MAG: hypothetical protein COT43_09435 [Candidatus Marinimicrobia bacterium CG08_land_8_20_14_0_20_45_22]|nr:MAG: hypothetical protein COT43_09435 [Candidatus Marinimicrobia bacterium CG08_land_8_20_14_0_20_45_22]